MALAARRPTNMTADALSRRERLVLAAGLSILALAARLTERHDRA
jgi:hypothetical protein